VVPGRWFRIVPVDDLVRLARIRIDHLGLRLDRIWIDVRAEMMVEPPPALRPHLRRIVQAVTDRNSRLVYRFRSQHRIEGQRIPY